ncbi:ATP phosphoribosyltransferase regulatory subunit [Helicobacter burdigaliensis]|uniref:ATP phosphoribosyltransferase regulatory subunit n=1 Tax=Helicobacter burdigaliensis TaxID=2315334 RepID=UPI000EF6AE05|nr:ATP phosphoribosyltransferase regulatory subunit [Helicobacter burdigaliensis]
MILSHEIPKGSKLYFGKEARKKRELENLISDLLYQEGYEEISTPSFAYLEHQRDTTSREVVRIVNQYNQQITLRHDSTIDTLRLLSPHIKEQRVGKKWFYMQPVFTYPTTEINQIGVENFENDCVLPHIKLCLEFLKKLALFPLLQISNAKIPKLCTQEFNVALEDFEKINLAKIQDAHPFLKALMGVQNLQNLQALLKEAPSSLKEELKELLELAKSLEYEKLILAPLFYAPMPYYDGMLFRFFMYNKTVILGGSYKINDEKACGFGIYTDHLLSIKE